MPKTSKKGPSAFSPIVSTTDPKAPKTVKGRARKAMTGDGRKGVNNLSKEEAADMVNNFFGVKSKGGKK